MLRISPLTHSIQGNWRFGGTGIQNLGRALLALITFGITYWLVAGIGFSLFAAGAPRAFRIVTGLACALLVAIALWRATAGNTAGLGSAMLRGAGILGGIGFIGGYAGPMIFMPEANQGPLLGIFITGPLGVVLGVIAGAIWWKFRATAA